MDQTHRYIEELTTYRARNYIDAIDALVRAVASNNYGQLVEARQRLGDVIADTMGVGEVIGATLALKKAALWLPHAGLNFGADYSGLTAFASSTTEVPTQTLMPRVVFKEALENMVERTPIVFKKAAERTAENIAKAYSKENVIAFVNTSEKAVVKEIQKILARAIKKGTTEVDAAAQIRNAVDKIGDYTLPWTEQYSKMVFRTNVNTAITSGRFRQALDPDVAEVIPAMRFDAVGDSDTRPNHLAADGFIAETTHEAWRNLAPPLGYSCRCSASFVGRPELRRMGRLDKNGKVKNSAIPRGAFPDPGFRHNDTLSFQPGTSP